MSLQNFNTIKKAERKSKLEKGIKAIEKHIVLVGESQSIVAMVVNSIISLQEEEIRRDTNRITIANLINSKIELGEQYHQAKSIQESFPLQVQIKEMEYDIRDAVETGVSHSNTREQLIQLIEFQLATLQDLQELGLHQVLKFKIYYKRNQVWGRK